MFKIKLIDHLIKNGYFLDESTARTFIMSGQVFANGERIMKPDEKISKKAYIEIMGQNVTYSSTDGYKLESALSAFGISILAKYAVDMFAMRGSISQALLSGGASGVYTLYNDKRAINKALLNIPTCKDVDITNFDDNSLIASFSSMFPPAQIAVLHSHSNSIKKYIPYFKYIMPAGDILWLIRPINEIDNPIIRKLGTMPKKAHSQLLKSITDTINSYEGMAVNGLLPAKYVPNGAPCEFFIHIKLGDNIIPFNIDEDYISDVVDSALSNK